ncbi:MAG TPA: hypothetical protein VMV74_12170 [Bacteroidales bacterium]|nr:hypothetical protein [Bacteroidales bacterium]
MKKLYILFLLLAVITACSDRGKVAPGNTPGKPADQHAGLVLIASDIVTDVVIRPDPEGDPWEIEKVAGFRGDLMVNTVFDLIYEGKLTAYDYHSGKPMKPGEVRDIEKEFSNDRSKIGKLSFTEDWYYDPATNSISKITKSVVFGFELYNGEGKVYAYKAAFKAGLGSQVFSHHK